MRPSRCAGTPDSMWSRGVPSRFGQAARTRSWLPPIPPDATITTGARSSNSPVTSRLLGAPRSAESGARTAPRTPTTRPSSTMSSSTRWRFRMDTRPLAAAACTRRTNGSTTPGPVPQVMWNRGTELPCPPADPLPRSAQPTTGKKRTPFSCSQARFSPAANCRYASAHWRGQWSSARSKPAVPNQSCRASSSESWTRRRRCSGESTRNSPPKDHHACPPSDASGSWSTRITRLPASASSAVATRPASPAPTTTTSALLCVLTAPTLAGRPCPAPSLGRATRPPGPAPLADRPAEGQHQRGQWADQQEDAGPQRCGTTERAEQEDQQQHGHQRQERRQGQDRPSPASALQHRDRAGDHDHREQQRDDEEPVDGVVRGPQQVAEVEHLERQQPAEHDGERNGGRAFWRRRDGGPPWSRPGRPPHRNPAARRG